MDRLLAAIAFVLLPLAGLGQRPTDPFAGKAPAVKPPDEATRNAIDGRLAKLRGKLDGLRSRVADDVLAEVEVYAKAADWVTRHGEYFGDTATWTVRVLDDGLRRADDADRAPVWRSKTGVSVPRAYRSKVDGSVQPYAVTAPTDFGRDRDVRWRLDVVLHGRDAALTEVKFLNSFRSRPAAEGQPFVQLDIFGRGNNAYRWAGETDVFEAIEAFLATTRLPDGQNLIDPRRIVLRGFSMGGAGSWHLGLHHPCRWAVTGPGAGFTTTHGYVPVPDVMPDHVERCLRIYDAVEYAENAATVPVVAYAGEKDKQLQAARNIEARLKPMNIPITLLIAPDTEHKLTPEYARKAEEQYARFASPGKGRPDWEEEVRFTTYTLKYPRCGWIELLGLERHYDKAAVEGLNRRDSNLYTIRTVNVRRLAVHPRTAAGADVVVSIDGQAIGIRPTATPVKFERRADGWHFEDKPPANFEKSPGLQGPIDDAFIGPFLCVRGTGTPWHAAPGQRAAAELDRFAKEWDKFLRGTLPVKDDTAVNADDIRSKHLVLFGDPASNSLIAKVLPKLPLTWTRDTIGLGHTTASSAEHLPVFIQPNPLNPAKYVVLNSGHTFHADAFRGSNALLFPRLGDYAILKLTPTAKDPLATEVVTAGLFDEFWK